MTVKDYKLTIKVRNNRILAAIKAAGGETGGKWCEANGLPYAGVNDLINLKASPIKPDGSLTVAARGLCDVLGCLPDELWSSEQVRPLETNFADLDLSHEQVASLMLGGDTYDDQPLLDHVQESETTAAIAAAIETLTAREQQAIRLRFFHDMTLGQTGDVMGVTPARVRQIEAKALRKLRHPNNISRLQHHVDLGHTIEYDTSLGVSISFAKK